MKFLFALTFTFSLITATTLAQELECQCTCKPKETTDAGVADSGTKPDGGTNIDAGNKDSGTIFDSGIADSGSVPVQDGAVARPSASKGVGFFTVNSKLYDGNGKEFRIRGTNKTHQDFWAPGLGKTKSNTTRWLVYFTEDPDRTIRDMQSVNIGGTTTNGKAVAIPGYWDGTCKNDLNTFNTMVNRWVRDAQKYQTFERYMMLNIANEWGGDEATWSVSYQAAIPKIRAAGFHGTIMVDAPGCGQNGMAIAHYGAAILNADPEKNVIFSWHIYGNVFDSVGGIPRQWSEQIDLIPTMDALRTTGLVVVIGEFGPGRNIGPSPTMLTPARIIDASEARGFGWLSWSWDDNNLAGGMSNDDSFSHSYNGNYNSAADLTIFGKVLGDYWNRLATPSSIFP